MCLAAYLFGKNDTMFSDMSDFLVSNIRVSLHSYLRAALKPAVHGEEGADESASRGGLISPCLAMFNIFGLARKIPHYVWHW